MVEITSLCLVGNLIALLNQLVQVMLPAGHTGPDVQQVEVVGTRSQVVLITAMISLNFSKVH